MIQRILISRGGVYAHWLQTSTIHLVRWRHSLTVHGNIKGGAVASSGVITKYGVGAGVLPPCRIKRDGVYRLDYIVPRDGTDTLGPHEVWGGISVQGDSNLSIHIPLSEGLWSWVHVVRSICRSGNKLEQNSYNAAWVVHALQHHENNYIQGRCEFRLASYPGLLTQRLSLAVLTRGKAW